MIVALPGLFSYLFFSYLAFCKQSQGSTSKERVLYPWERILSFRVERIRTPTPKGRDVVRKNDIVSKVLF